MLSAIFLPAAFSPLSRTREVVERHLRRHRLDRVGARGVDAAGLRHAVAQLERALQVDRAPWTGLGLVAHLLVGVRQQLLALPVVRVGEDDVLERLGHPAVLALVEVGLRLLQDRRGAAHVLDVLLRRLLRRQLVERRRVGVVEAHVALIDGAGVVLHRAVVAAVVPLLVELGRQLDHVGDLDAGVALVHQVHRLVVDVLVHVAVLLPVVDDLRVAPYRPVVALELDLGVLAVEIDRLVEEARPLQRIAHLRAAQRQDVVQRVGRVLRHPHRLELREVRVHLGRRLGARRHLEHHLHAVDRDASRRSS